MNNYKIFETLLAMYKEGLKPEQAHRIVRATEVDHRGLVSIGEFRSDLIHCVQQSENGLNPPTANWMVEVLALECRMEQPAQLIYIRHSHRVPSIKPINTDQERTTTMDNQRQIEINRAHQYLQSKMLERELKRLDRVYYCTLTLAVITILGGMITYINSIWSV